ncbi:Sec61beta family protein [Candidatus Gugararchaeum adminiculabundum]|nr:Sec61beta family protein [Candidatus Gugararchaeum adminiculabundum]
MASGKKMVSTPTSSAGILSFASMDSGKGPKFDPRAVVAFAVLFILGVKVLSLIIR